MIHDSDESGFLADAGPSTSRIPGIEIFVESV